MRPYFLNLLHTDPVLEGKSWRLWHSWQQNFLLWNSLLTEEFLIHIWK